MLLVPKASSLSSSHPPPLQKASKLYIHLCTFPSSASNPRTGCIQSREAGTRPSAAGTLLLHRCPHQVPSSGPRSGSQQLHPPLTAQSADSQRTLQAHPCYLRQERYSRRFQGTLPNARPGKLQLPGVCPLLLPPPSILHAEEAPETPKSLPDPRAGGPQPRKSEHSQDRGAVLLFRGPSLRIPHAIYRRCSGVVGQRKGEVFWRIFKKLFKKNIPY